LVLAVVFAFPQLNMDPIAFLPEIGERRGIAINPFIRTRYAFFFRSRIIECRDIDIEWNVGARRGRPFECNGSGTHLYGTKKIADSSRRREE
jgi:hypothetical protein